MEDWPRRCKIVTRQGGLPRRLRGGRRNLQEFQDCLGNRLATPSPVFHPESACRPRASAGVPLSPKSYPRPKGQPKLSWGPTSARQLITDGESEYGEANSRIGMEDSIGVNVAGQDGDDGDYGDDGDDGNDADHSNGGDGDGDGEDDGDGDNGAEEDEYLSQVVYLAQTVR
ncbi:hypothetical protein E4U13_005793 [Claviceps humidiphila]|uniref:Uncharacterized protein n=1 Tax=Claviceps humidiphila TaxID=1294629 RepID=A0A9P7TNC4_9HYPO|nr:hypothetical protein E4U13_005793 [Claviceps humidiphila]